jgi:hypothetical protein
MHHGGPELGYHQICGYALLESIVPQHVSRVHIAARDDRLLSL